MTHPIFAEFKEFSSDIQCVHRGTAVEQSDVCLWKCRLKKRQISHSHQNRPCDQIMEICTVDPLSACLFLSSNLIGGANVKESSLINKKFITSTKDD